MKKQTSYRVDAYGKNGIAHYTGFFYTLRGALDSTAGLGRLKPCKPADTEGREHITIERYVGTPTREGWDAQAPNYDTKPRYYLIAK